MTPAPNKLPFPTGIVAFQRMFPDVGLRLRARAGGSLE